MSVASQLRAKFFPQMKPIVRFVFPPPKPTLLLPPSETDVEIARLKARSAARREAHRLAVLAIYDEGVRFGRVRPWKNGDGDGAVDIVRHVCENHDISVMDLRGRGRTKVLVQARREISLILRRDLGMSFPAIGRVLGRDHTSIMALLGRISHKRVLASHGVSD